MKEYNSPLRGAARALLILFYGVFLMATVLSHLFAGSHLLHLLVRAVSMVAWPGMFFAAGGLLCEMDFHRKSARKELLTTGLFFLLTYFVLGLLSEVLIKHRAVFATIKDLLAILRIPGICGIFLSLGALFVLCGLLGEWMETFFSKKWIWILCCAVGFFLVFLPDRLLGYGLVGIFVGGDRFSCIPIGYYLAAFCWGAFSFGVPLKNSFGESFFENANSYRELFRNAFSKSNLLLTAGFFVLGAGMLALHQKQAAFVLLGTGCAFVAAVVGLFFLPLYEKAEKIFLRIVHFCSSIYGSLLSDSGDGRLDSHLSDSPHPFGKRYAASGAFRTMVYYIGYTFLFIVMTCFIFVPYIQNHTTLIWSVDGLGQYVPKIYRFMSYIPSVFHDLLSGNLNFQQYDFTSGLGATVAISFDPIYWLYLLFDTSKIESVYSGMIVLRFFLAGASMSALLLYFKKSPLAAYTASMMYTFSGYAVYAGTKHGQFLTPLILLPVLVIAMEQLITKKKWYLMTVLVALSLLCSYYFLYMNTIVLGIYFVLRILCTKEYRNFKIFFMRGLTIVGSYALGASIGIISLFTSFASYMGSSRTEGGDVSDFLSTTPLYYRTSWIADFFVSFLSDSFTPGMWLKLGFAPLALLAVVLLFTRKNRKELRWMFVLFSLFCIFPLCGYIFSGFGSVTNRWCYIYAAIVAFILAENMEHALTLTGKEIGIIFSVAAFYGCIVFFSTRYLNDKVLAAFGLLAITVAAVLLVNQERVSMALHQKKALLFAVTMLAIIFNANLFIMSGDEDSSHLDTYVPAGKSLSRISNTALKYLGEVTGDEETTKEDGFYRSTNLENYGATRSSSLIYGYNDLSTFTSTLSGGIVNYNSAMGNCDWNIVSIYSYNFRTYLNELASVRYLGVSSEDCSTIPYGYEKVFEKTPSAKKATKKAKKNKTTYSIYENTYALPLGYTYDNVIGTSKASQYSAAEKQELTMLSAIVDDDTLEENANIGSAESLPLTARKLDIKNMKLKGVKKKDGMLYVEGPGSSITFTFDGEPNAETYLSFDGDLYAEKDAAEHFLKTNVKAEGVRYQYKFRIDSYTTGQDEFLFNLGYHENGITSCKLTFLSDGILKYDDISVYSQTMDTYAERVGALKANSLENVKTDKNTVTGDITVDRDKMLVITLPYQTGWSAYVDGEKADIQKVNYQYMGLNLTAGSHSIRLHYQLPGIKYAFLITIGGLVIFIGIIVFQWAGKKRKQK